MAALLGLGAGPAQAQAQRATTAFAVGAVVPSPSCVAAVTQRERLSVTCSGTVPFIAQAAMLSGNVSWDGIAPSLSVSLLSEAGSAVMREAAPHAGLNDGVLITVIY